MQAYQINSKTNQAGFSLVEVIVTIAIIGILTAGLMTALSSGDDSKVTALFAKAQDISRAVSLYEAKTGCVPNQLAVLFNKNLAIAANNYCGQDTTALYGSEDYISAMPVDPINTSNLDLAKLGFAGGQIWIQQNYGGISDYVLVIGGLALNDTELLVSKCDGIDYTNGTAMPPATAIATTPCTGDSTSNIAVMLINKY